MKESRFGDCCKDLRDALTAVPNSLFRVEDNGALYLTIGYGESPEGTAWFDQAPIFCAFCGVQLQVPEDIRRKSSQP